MDDETSEIPDVAKVLELHALWLDGDPDGCRGNLRGLDLSGTDFSGRRLASFDFRGSDLTKCNFQKADCRRVRFYAVTSFAGCDFTGADITGADFEAAAAAVADLKLVGAIWDGQPITMDPLVYEDDYFSLATDQHIQIGCQILALEEFAGMDQAERAALDKADPFRARAWCERNAPWVLKLQSNRGKIDPIKIEPQSIQGVTDDAESIRAD